MAVNVLLGKERQPQSRAKEKYCAPYVEDSVDDYDEQCAGVLPQDSPYVLDEAPLDGSTSPTGSSVLTTEMSPPTIRPSSTSAAILSDASSPLVESHNKEARSAVLNPCSRFKYALQGGEMTDLYGGADTQDLTPGLVETAEDEIPTVHAATGQRESERESTVSFCSDTSDNLIPSQHGSILPYDEVKRHRDALTEIPIYPHYSPQVKELIKSVLIYFSRTYTFR
jgi:hypothetical protein